MEWERKNGDYNEDYKISIMNFFRNLNPRYFIIGRYNLWSREIESVINYVFIDLQDAKDVRKQLNDKTSKFCDWDCEYTMRGSRIKKERNIPEKTKEEKQKELGCRYPGDFYNVCYDIFIIEKKDNNFKIIYYDIIHMYDDYSSSIFTYDYDFDNLKHILEDDRFIKSVNVKKINCPNIYESIESMEFGYCFPKKEDYSKILNTISNMFSSCDSNYFKLLPLDVFDIIYNIINNTRFDEEEIEKFIVENFKEYHYRENF